MAVYHFTIHAYRSWRPDHRRGYVHHTDGLLPPDPLMATWHDAHAKFQPVPFDDEIQRILISGSHDICTRRSWRLHACGMDPTHLHLMVSWRPFTSCADVLNKLKNVLSWQLGQQVGPVGRRWFVRGGSMRRVANIGHFTYLVRRYFPDHPGLFWPRGIGSARTRRPRAADLGLKVGLLVAASGSPPTITRRVEPRRLHRERARLQRHGLPGYPLPNPTVRGLPPSA